MDPTVGMSIIGISREVFSRSYFAMTGIEFKDSDVTIYFRDEVLILSDTFSAKFLSMAEIKKRIEEMACPVSKTIP